MSGAIVSLIFVAIILIGTLAMSQGALSSVDAISGSWKQAEKHTGEMRRTDLALVAASVQAGGAEVIITLENKGDVALDNFPRWDVVVEYYEGNGNYHIRWLPYTEGAPANNEWTVTGIYLDAQGNAPEIFEPDILNPQEQAVLKIKLNPKVGAGSTNRALIVTPNGVVTWVNFNG